ncbi:hypothetical protein MHYP_G00020880 [Metynnis hypsauchen]
MAEPKPQRSVKVCPCHWEVLSAGISWRLGHEETSGFPQSSLTWESNTEPQDKAFHSQTERISKAAGHKEDYGNFARSVNQTDTP